MEITMLMMKEVFGSSPTGYSEAVRSAVERLLDDGEKVHFFQVTELRGAVRDGKFREFQVIVKAALED